MLTNGCTTINSSSLSDLSWSCSRCVGNAEIQSTLMPELEYGLQSRFSFDFLIFWFSFLISSVHDSYIGEFSPCGIAESDGVFLVDVFVSACIKIIRKRIAVTFFQVNMLLPSFSVRIQPLTDLTAFRNIKISVVVTDSLCLDCCGPWITVKTDSEL